jgi:mRNA interferase MazF
VVQADRLGTGLPQTLVAMISSNMARQGHPSRVAIWAGSAAGRQAGLPLDSVIMTDNLATIHLLEIDRVIGTIEMRGDVDSALRTTLAL